MVPYAHTYNQPPLFTMDAYGLKPQNLPSHPYFYINVLRIEILYNMHNLSFGLITIDIDTQLAPRYTRPIDIINHNTYLFWVRSPSHIGISRVQGLYIRRIAIYQTRWDHNHNIYIISGTLPPISSRNRWSSGLMDKMHHNIQELLGLLNVAYIFFGSGLSLIAIGSRKK